MAGSGVSPGAWYTSLSPTPQPGLLKEPAVLQLGTSLLEVAGNRVGLEVEHVSEGLD